MRFHCLDAGQTGYAVHDVVGRVLDEMLAQPAVGLVSSLFRGVGEGGIGGILEALQLNGFVSGGVSALTELEAVGIDQPEAAQRALAVGQRDFHVA